MRYAVRANGSSETREADLAFIDERPFAVLEWAQTGAAMVTVELDATKLHSGRSALAALMLSPIPHKALVRVLLCYSHRVNR